MNRIYIVEQGRFESNELELYSESDLRGSLDNELLLNENENKDEKIKIIDQDYQLSRAIDLIKALSILKSA